jgi:hypothetical protein
VRDACQHPKELPFSSVNWIAEAVCTRALSRDEVQLSLVRLKPNRMTNDKYGGTGVPITQVSYGGVKA